jgi:hypothetical protein
LEQQAQRAAWHAARIDADAGRCQPRADGSHQVGAAGNVAAARGERAARILYEAAHHQVCARVWLGGWRLG